MPSYLRFFLCNGHTWRFRSHPRGIFFLPTHGAWLVPQTLSGPPALSLQVTLITDIKCLLSEVKGHIHLIIFSFLVSSNTWRAEFYALAFNPIRLRVQGICFNIHVLPKKQESEHSDIKNPEWLWYSVVPKGYRRILPRWYVTGMLWTNNSMV